MFATILFCALSIAPENCDEVSARRYERVPGGHALPATCLQQAELWAAEHALAARAGEYPKIRCSRHHFGGRVG